MSLSPSAVPSPSTASLVSGDVVRRPRVRRISQADLDWALSEGWEDFKAKRGDILVLAFIYPLVGIVAILLTFNGAMLPLVFPMVAGLSIFGPAAASGFYEIARRREIGLESGWLHVFDPWRGPGRAGPILLTFGLALWFLVWLGAAWMIYAATIGADYPLSRAEFLRRLFSTPQGLTMIVLGNGIGFVFACITLAFAATSFPMVVDKPVGVDVAVETSIRAVAANPRVMASWGLRVAGLLVLGCLPAFIGLAVVLPVLGYATWHLYTRLVER